MTEKERIDKAAENAKRTTQLRWEGSQLFLGKICVGYIRSVDGDRTWGVFYPSCGCEDYDSGFYETALMGNGYTDSYEKAVELLETFIKEQTGI